MKKNRLISIITILSLCFIPIVALAQIEADNINFTDPLNRTVTVGNTLLFTLTATSNRTVTFSYSPAITGASIGTVTKSGTTYTAPFTWTPTSGQVGTYSVRYRATGGSATQYYDRTITVNSPSTTTTTSVLPTTTTTSVLPTTTTTSVLPTTTTTSCPAGSGPNLPAIDFVGSWTFTPGEPGGTLSLYNLSVTQSVITSSPPEFYQVNTPGVEEIIQATINIPLLSQDDMDPYFFGNSTLSITETGNTYLTSNFIAIEFIPIWNGPLLTRLNLNPCFAEDNLTDVDTSSNTNPSRFIDELITLGAGYDTPNMRLTLDVLAGQQCLFPATVCSGSCAGKIESAVGLPPTTTTTTVLETTTTTVEPTTTTVEPTTTTTAPTTVVDLARFELIPGHKKVTVSWDTETEIDNAGFNIYRADSDQGKYTKLNSSLIPADGTSTQGSHYEFEDRGLKNRVTYYYILEDVDDFGKSTYHGPITTTPRLMYRFKK